MTQSEFNRRADKITSWASVVMIGVMYWMIIEELLR